jgi:hypothetical protein
MPRFYFDIRDGQNLVPDEEGLEFDGLEAAKASAIRALTEMIKDALPNGRSRDLAIVIRDRPDHALTTARISFELNRSS